MSTTINIDEADLVRLKRIAQEVGLSTRDTVTRVIDVYIKAQGPEARKVTIVLNVDMYKGVVQTTAKAKPYKPWLGRTDTDDLQEMSPEEAEARYGPDRLPDAEMEDPYNEAAAAAVEADVLTLEEIGVVEEDTDVAAIEAELKAQEHSISDDKRLEEDV